VIIYGQMLYMWTGMLQLIPRSVVVRKTRGVHREGEKSTSYMRRNPEAGK